MSLTNFIEYRKVLYQRFSKKFGEPTLAKFITPSNRYAYTLGVHELIEPSIKAKTTMLIKQKDLHNWLDKIGRRIDKIGKTGKVEKMVAGVRGRPTTARKEMWELMDKYETATEAGLTGEKAKIFTELRFRVIP